MSQMLILHSYLTQAVKSTQIKFKIAQIHKIYSWIMKKQYVNKSVYHMHKQFRSTFNFVVFMDDKDIQKFSPKIILFAQLLPLKSNKFRSCIKLTPVITMIKDSK